MDMSTGGTALGPMTTSSDPTQNGKVGLCIKNLSGSCQMTSVTCPQKHPSDPMEIKKWLTYFNGQPCKNGDRCDMPKCIYDHPRRPGWSGQNINLVVGATL